MAASISNDLNSPVSLLWAHQLRREHAAIVAELAKVQEALRLHRSSSTSKSTSSTSPAGCASELKRLVTRTEKVEAADAKSWKELTELKASHQKSVEDIEALKKDLQAWRRAEERKEEEDHVVHRAEQQQQQQQQQHDMSLRLEMASLSEMLVRQQAQLSDLVVEVREMQRRVGDGAIGGQRTVVQKGEEGKIAHLRTGIHALDRRADEEEEEEEEEAGVTMVKESLGSHGAKEAPAALQDDVSVSDAESFDLDANVMNVAATPSEPIHFSSLAMIKEPTVPRSSSQARSQRYPSMGESMELLPEPSLPTEAKRLDPKTIPERITRPEVSLVQAKSTLSTYIHVANSQYQEITSPDEERFVTAFMQGLRDKRDRKKCGRKFRETGKTWETLKKCFPVACQQTPGLGSRKVCVARKVGEGEEREVKECDVTLKVLTTKERMEFENSEKADSPPPPPRVAVKQVDHKMHLEGGVERVCLPTALEVAVKKRTLVEKEDGEVENLDEKKSAAAKKKRTKREKRRPEKPPSIPILPSSDDEFSRGGVRGGRGGRRGGSS